MAKKYYFNEHNTYDKNKLTSRKSVIEIDDEGNRIITTRINRNEEKTFKDKLSFGFSLFGKLFMIAAILFFGGYFFNEGYNESVLLTQKEEVITNELNGVEYDYNVKFSDYDYTYKLNQLSLLRNVFDLSPNNYVASSSLIIPNGGNLTTELFNQNLIGNIEIKQYTFIDLQTHEEITINYLTYTLGFKIASWVRPNLQKEYESYVNIGNLQDYINLNYVTESVELQPKVLSIILRVLTYLNAPIIWLGNFMYDLGVIMNIIIEW